MYEVRWCVSLKRQFPRKRRNVALYFSFWVGGTLHVHICVEAELGLVRNSTAIHLSPEVCFTILESNYTILFHVN